jgi:hypothetical protein
VSTYAPRVARALDLVDAIEGVLTTAEVPNADKVTVTLDDRDIDKTAYQQHGVILVERPKITYPGPTVRRYEWPIVVVCKATGNPLDSWTRLDELVGTLEQHFEFTEASPGSRPRPDGQSTLPGYTLTLTEEDQD